MGLYYAMITYFLRSLVPCQRQMDATLNTLPCQRDHAYAFARDRTTPPTTTQITGPHGNRPMFVPS